MPFWHHICHHLAALHPQTFVPLSESLAHQHDCHYDHYRWPFSLCPPSKGLLVLSVAAGPQFSGLLATDPWYGSQSGTGALHQPNYSHESSGDQGQHQGQLGSPRMGYDQCWVTHTQTYKIFCITVNVRVQFLIESPELNPLTCGVGLSPSVDRLKPQWTLDLNQRATLATLMLVK